MNAKTTKANSSKIASRIAKLNAALTHVTTDSKSAVRSTRKTLRSVKATSQPKAPAKINKAVAEAFPELVTLRSVTRAQILDRLLAQQDQYAKDHRVTDAAAVNRSKLNKYAKACYKAFRANFKLCLTAKDFKRLHKFYMAKTALTGKDFLNANLI